MFQVTKLLYKLVWYTYLQKEIGFFIKCLNMLYFMFQLMFSDLNIILALFEEKFLKEQIDKQSRKHLL